jgi:AraC family transcriptional regulator, regulatory protein of adaptative response / DNA-3-methyladenine glycosylase II
MSENGEHRPGLHAKIRAMNTPQPLPDSRICDQARRSRDPRFDGLFFTAVTSTRIYCRPVCPAPAPKPGNIRYFANAAAAEAAGFRPCLRCRPELAPGSASWRRADDHVARALRAINEGVLQEGGVEAVSARLGIGARQLRRLFDQQFGASPVAVATTQRLLFAKQLLSETSLSMIDIALASGFGSLRRFNAAFQDAYRMPPSRLRAGSDAVQRNDRLQLKLAYRPPFDFAASLGFLAGRTIPDLEDVTHGCYRRRWARSGGEAWIEVAQYPGEHALRVTAHNVDAVDLHDCVRRIRRMFDLDADPASVTGVLRADALFAGKRAFNPGLRIPGGYDGFEVAIRAVLGQQISVAATTTFARRLVARFGESVSLANAAMIARFPTPEQLADADLESIGIIRSRAQTLRALARAVAEGRLHFATDQSLEHFVASATALPGIGDWTAHYIALRALSHPDAFPAGDLILRRQAAIGDSALTEKALRARAEVWRPWRGYAVIQLWQQASKHNDR